MTLYMGIDGGGSTLRVIIVNEDLHPLSESQHASANPGVVGRQEAAYRIQYTMRDALARAKLAPQEVAAAGAGIAGAASPYYRDWLTGLLHDVLPTAHLSVTSDMEIALTGAHAERRGILVLAGTGSVALGINQHGQRVQAGGWGYLLGDEGSGYWLGLRALHYLTLAADGRAAPTALGKRLLHELALASPAELIPWLYAAAMPRTREIAALAPLILEGAEQGLEPAVSLVEEAAHALAALCHTVQKRLHLPHARIAFAGGLLQALNPLSRRLCALLDLSMLPEAIHTPVVGAALLARLDHTHTTGH
ncbi:MAG: hypothetical protein MUE40_18405 [Anaerolineae bacterium]|nr:hypothetical protein [Anaerolineae bacterium]